MRLEALGCGEASGCVRERMVWLMAALMVCALASAATQEDAAYGSAEPAPIVEGLLPQAGLRGATVMITGQHLENVREVKFGTAVASFTPTSSHEITATAPEGYGTVDVRVFTRAQGSAITEEDRFTYQSLEALEIIQAEDEAQLGHPAIFSLRPDAVLMTGGETVVVKGANLAGAEEVLAGGDPVRFAAFSRSTLLFEVPILIECLFCASKGGQASSEDRARGSGSATPLIKIRPGTPTFIEVKTPTGTSARSQLGELEEVPPGPPPSVTGVAPNSSPSGGDQLVTISGGGLVGVEEVLFGGQKASEVRPEEEAEGFVLTARAPAGVPGTVPVTVVTPNGASSLNANATYTYRPPEAPAISYLQPRSGPLVGGQLVTIGGTGFAPGMLFELGSHVVTPFGCVRTSCRIVTPEARFPGAVDIHATLGSVRSAPSGAARYVYQRQRG